MSVFRTSFAKSIFKHKYAHEGAETWEELSRTLVEDVCRDGVSQDIKEELIKIHSEMKFLAGGRYLYYAGRPHKFFNNCYLLSAEEDTRQDWANLSWKSENALMTGGGIGVNYSIYRPKNSPLSKTGGVASGPVSKMRMINEIGREVQQGGARRSAIYASLDWRHPDAQEFMTAKNWREMKIPGTQYTIADLKELDFNFAAPLDMTNISLDYGNDFIKEVYALSNDLFEFEDGVIKDTMNELPIITIPEIFVQNTRQALSTGEPGFSFNFFSKLNEVLRNACTEVCSEDDSDVCNLGSLNLSRFDTLGEFKSAVELGTIFLLFGTLRAELPYEKVYKVREKNRRLGLGIMGIHEWLMKRGYRYEMVDELREWMQAYKDISDETSRTWADKLGISRPVANRAVAPNGTIGIMACTTTGIEPLFATAYRRRYLKSGHAWHYQYVVDGTAKVLINEYGLEPDQIETALDLAAEPERRISFQADVQDYVDMSISSTINLPEWGSELNNEDDVVPFAKTLLKYAHRLRGFTCYPDGARGGQPLTPVRYAEAIELEGEEFEEAFADICDISGKGGTCGV